ncbi:hypothetical protein SDC9_127280 [bioreactor metagenome]|uniref:DsrE/DsrF-like family protein n=1 Tax=bioreactor metagenome TaxID=1076179 RepID=A0A645CTI2_9ZZZZ
MKLHVLLTVDQSDRIELLLNKFRNLRDYCDHEGHELVTEIVVMGNAVSYFRTLADDNVFLNLPADVALCNNALQAQHMEPVTYKNVRTVYAGIGEIVTKKQQGWVDYVV